MSDRELVDACRKGDRGAQKALYDRFSPRMMALCLRYGGDASTAADMMQEGFITVFEKLGQYSGEGALGGWIRRIMVNSALLYIRREKKHFYHEDTEEQADLIQEDVSVYAKLATDQLLELIAQLPDGYRTVFNLFAIEGYSHKEIAAKLGISESTSKTQFFKARKHLQAQVSSLEQP